MKPIQICRVGRFTATNGVVVNFTESMLKDAVAAYNPEAHEAPIVIGHPKEADPAYGWVQALSFSDGILVANPNPATLDADFAEIVEKGRYRKVSASWYLPDAPGNPAPGKLGLRHVGFLGAVPPAIKGLKSVSFNESESGIVEFADWGELRIAGMFRGLRDWMIGKFGLEEADKALPGFVIDSAQIDAATATESLAQQVAEQISPAFSEQDRTMTPEQIKKREAELAAQAADFAEREKRIKLQEKSSRRAGLVEFVEGLVKAGKVLPASKEGLVAFMEVTVDDGVVEFGEGDKKKSETAMTWLKGFLNGLPKVVDFSEVVKPHVNGTGVVNFAAPEGTRVDAAGLDLHAKAEAYARQHNVSYVDAVRALQ